MSQFRYQAKSGPGAVSGGTVQADNREAAVKKLRQDGLFVVSIAEQRQDETERGPAGWHFSRRVDIGSFTRQLASLVRSGFPLSSGLATLEAQEQNPAFRKVIADVNQRLQKGGGFSESLAAYPALFSSFFLSLVRIGESSGKLDETLERLAEFKEKEDELLAQVRSALTYPAFLFVVGLGTVFVLLAFFIPRLAGIFADFGQKLPVATVMVMRAGDFFSQYWYLILGAAVAAVVVLRTNYRNEKFRLSLDRFLLEIPGVRTVILKMEISRFAYALGVLLQNGVSMLEALGVVSLSVDNRFLRSKIAAFQSEISEGRSLSSCLAADRIFPVILTNMVAVGEESGVITDMLFRIAANFETEVNRDLKTVVSLLEPILIICIGGIVVVMVAAVLMPIFQLDLFA